LHEGGRKGGGAGDEHSRDVDGNVGEGEGSGEVSKTLEAGEYINQN
jgi:hypothetical protein